MSDFEKELTVLINKHKEISLSYITIPNWMLAQYIVNSLKVFAVTIQQYERWIKTEDISKEQKCCFPDCMKSAKWKICIHHESKFACIESTFACTEHVGELLTDAFEYRVFPIEKKGVNSADREKLQS